MRTLTREEMKEIKGSASDGEENICDCADTYMGAELVGGSCRFVDGEMVYRHCLYEY